MENFRRESKKDAKNFSFYKRIGQQTLKNDLPFADDII
jgi:hypothetical protein